MKVLTLDSGHFKDGEYVGEVDITANRRAVLPLSPFFNRSATARKERGYA